MESIHKTFWREGLVTGLILACLIALQMGATALSKTPHGRSPAMLIKLTADRAILFDAGVTGYYERLLNDENFGVNFQRHGEYVPGSYRIYRLKPNRKNLPNGPLQGATNSFGFVGREWSLQKPPNTRRIVLLGDSITEGYGVRSDQRFGHVFRDWLNATHPHGSEQFEVLNCAVPGYNLTQLVDVAKKDASRFEPDVYVLDLTEISVFRSWDKHLVDMTKLGVDPKYDFLRTTLREAKVSRTDDVATLHAKLAPYRIAIVRHMLLEFKSNAEQHHAQFVVLLLPSLEDADLAEKRFAGIPELLNSLNITTVNLLDTFDPLSDMASLRIDKFDVHPNAEGHAMIAANLIAKIQARPSAWSALIGDTPGGD